MTQSHEKLTPERAVRLLRAKAGELEVFSKRRLIGEEDIPPVLIEVGYLAADIALIASLLADHIEHVSVVELLDDDDEDYVTNTDE